jgi:hypothetical protein
MCPSVMLVVASPVRQCEVLLALEHLSAAGTPSCLLVQELCTQDRGCPQGSLSIMGLEGRLPVRIERVGVALELAVALRCPRLLHSADLAPARWRGAPPGFARLRGERTVGDPTAGFSRVPLLGPSLQPPPDQTVEFGEGCGTQHGSLVICPTPQPGVETRDEPGRGGTHSWLTQGLPLRFEAWATAVAGGDRPLGRGPIPACMLTPGLPADVTPVDDGRHDGLCRRPPAAACG